jgi:hypothetical protein
MDCGASFWLSAPETAMGPFVEWQRNSISFSASRRIDIFASNDAYTGHL